MEYRADSNSVVFETGSKNGMSHVVLGREGNGFYFTRALNIPIDETTSDFEGYGAYGLSLETALMDLADRLKRYGTDRGSKVGSNLAMAIAQALS